MIKSKAFVDTTILTNRLIKFRGEKKEAKDALAKYEITELPVYAIKEFKAGPLDYVKYLYNKLLETESIGLTIIALTNNFRQKNKQATSLKLIGELLEEVKLSRTNNSLKAKYGRLADEESISYDSVKLETKLLTYKSWKKRRSVTTTVVQPLSCYQETAPFEEKNGLLSLKPNKCKTDNCCLIEKLREKRFDVTKLKVAIGNLPEALKTKPENVKRQKILREINSKPSIKISDSDCRNLGDAVFALFCPENADILTTNIKDHKPLANALGKTAISPEQVLSQIPEK
jgi:hypothetical protein